MICFGRVVGQFIAVLLQAMVLLVSGGIVPASAAPCCPKHKFSVPLPEDWLEIPQETIELFSQKVHQLNPAVPPQRYQYAFQPESTEQWFSYPYILVQVLDTGRVEESKLQQLPTLGEQRNKVGKQLAADFSSVLGRLELGKAVYDPSEQIVWSRSASRLAVVGEVHSLSGTVLTANGAVVVHCYAKGDQISALAPVFESFIRGIRLAPELQFNP